MVVLPTGGLYREEEKVQQKRIQRAEAPKPPHVARRTSAITLPEVVDIDVLGGMQDEDLVLRLRALEEDRTRALANGRYDPRPWETEVAYVRREQQIRRARRDTHAEWAWKIKDEFDRLEASLPNGDFDNTAFVYAASGGRGPRWN
jgi:hypothetical protein